MRFYLALLLAVAPVAAAAQAPTLPTATLDAIRQHFPLDHQPIAASMAGKPPEDARRAAYAGIDAFLSARRQKIVSAPASTVIALEARQGAMLRALDKQDVRLCARISDSGFFGTHAAAGVTPEGLDAYGAALVQAAASGSSASAALATREDFETWLKRVEATEPAIPVQAMLSDPTLRAASSPEDLCRGAAAMHEAAAALPPEQAERVSRTLLGAVIGTPAAR